MRRLFLLVLVLLLLDSLAFGYEDDLVAASAALGMGIIAEHALYEHKLGPVKPQCSVITFLLSDLPQAPPEMPIISRWPVAASKQDTRTCTAGVERARALSPGCAAIENLIDGATMEQAARLAGFTPDKRPGTGCALRFPPALRRCGFPV